MKEIASAGGTAVSVKANVTSKADIHHLVQQSVHEFGSVDVFVNNAGIDQVALYYMQQKMI